MSLSRRVFLKSSLAAGAAVAMPNILLGDSNKVYRVALIGSGWWGMNILKEAIAYGQCKVVALCNVDGARLDETTAEVEQLTGDRPKKYKDYRELLDKEKPEIVINATPDHWHALITIAACKAGADVYVEKPVSHTVNEGIAMVRAARDTDRVVQVGTHRRVSAHNIAANKFLKEGKAGKIGMVRCFVHYHNTRNWDRPDSEPPAGLDWDFWCGPAPLRPYNRGIHPRGFRQYLDYANGQLGDWGIHWLDQVLWWSEEKYPKSVYSTGGKFVNSGMSDAPDTQVVNYEFENFICTWEHRQYAANETEKHSIGIYFYGSKGIVHVGWQDGFTFYPAHSRDGDNGEPLHVEPQLHTRDEHNIKELWADFMKSVADRSRPVCDIEIGHRSTNMSLLGMLSMKLGRSVKWDGEKGKIIGDAEASKLLQRDYRKPWEYPKV